MEAYFPDYLHKLTTPVTNDSMYFLEPKTFSNYGTIMFILFSCVSDFNSRYCLKENT